MTDYNEEKCVEMKQTTPLPAVTVEAMAYVPYQQYKTIYSAEKGLDKEEIVGAGVGVPALFSLNLISHFWEPNGGI